MGMGDEIIATGEARRVQERFAKKHPNREVPKVTITDRHGRPRWHLLWDKNPRIARPGEQSNALSIKHGARCRPYIDYERMQAEWPWPQNKYNIRIVHPKVPWRFTDAKVRKGELFTRRLPRVPDRVIIEPHFKQITPNREWPIDRYQSVVEAFPDVSWVQLTRPGEATLRGVQAFQADTPIRACEILSSAAAYFGPEGGLYHAAAALDVPAVAIFGGYVSPANQGYDDARYVNIYEPMDGESPCGQRVRCEHCKEAMNRITVDRVCGELKWLLDLGK